MIRRQVGESFMTYLERLMKAKGLNQADLARKMDVTPSAVCYWLSGEKEPEAAKYPKLARILGISAIELTRVITPEDARETAGAR